MRTFTKYRISANSFRGNYSFLNLTLCTVTFDHRTYRCGNYSREETIQGRKVFAEIRYFFYFSLFFYVDSMEGFSVMAFASCRDRQQLTVHATIQISLTQPNNEVIPTQRPGIFFLFQFFFSCWLFGRCFNGNGSENRHTCK